LILHRIWLLNNSQKRNRNRHISSFRHITEKGLFDRISYIYIYCTLVCANKTTYELAIWFSWREYGFSAAEFCVEGFVQCFQIRCLKIYDFQATVGNWWQYDFPAVSVITFSLPFNIVENTIFLLRICAEAGI
jgi:hypothetical protein